MRALWMAMGAWAALALPADAAKLCAWMDETADDEDFRELKLWFEADAEFDGYYMIKGEGLSSEGMKAHSPHRGTFFLRPKAPESLWGFGATLTPPGKIDVVVEIRAKPADIFSDEPPRLLASFTFHRDVAEGEKAPPKTFAEKQCATVGK